jgi:DNA-binding CsgD family transcriptional regulator/tetratricopeptide (TPR) repeat protein
MPSMAAGDGAPARFVGRERELEAILDATAAAAAGHSATILLEGSSGMGASRLIDEALSRLDDTGAPGPPSAIIRAERLPAWRDAPYAPFRSALDAFLDGRAADEALALLGPGAEVLLALLPRTAERLGAADRRPATRERLADRILEAFRGVVGRVAAAGPVVLVVEDLHVLDAASRSLLDFLSRTLGDRPVTLIGSYQPDALGPGHPLRATLNAVDAGPRPPRRIMVPPLDRAALRQLITSHEGAPPSAPVLLLVAERSGGSPLIAEEVLVARHELSGASLTVPLEQMVVGRAARRTPECRRVLRILAVAGGPLTPAELGAVAAAYDAEMGRPAPRSSSTPRRGGDGLDGDLAAGVAEAVAHGFVERVSLRAGERLAAGERAPGRRGEAGRAPGQRAATGRRSAEGRPGEPPPALRIRHEIIAAALDADLLPGPRRRMHAVLAAVLADHPAEASRHWHRAHEATHELEWTIVAAAEAEEIGAAADALVHLERAIELAGAPVAVGALSTAEEVDLLGRAADAAAAAGDTGRAEAFIEAALARHTDRSDRAVRADLTARLGSYRLAGGDIDGAITAFERALELLVPEPGVARARLLATFAQVRLVEGAFSEATHLAEGAIAATAGAGADARAWLGHATCTLGAVDGWLGRTEAAVSRLEEALAIARELGRLDDAFRARANLATILDLDGRRVAAVEVTAEGIEAATAAGLEVAQGNLLRGNAADFLVSLGRWSEARDMARRALDWAPSGVPLVNAALYLAFIETETVAGEEAARLLGRLFLELETIRDVQYAAPAYQVAASLALWRGDLADAERAARAAWDRIRDTEDWPLAARSATTALRVAAAQVRAAGQRNDLAAISAARSWAATVLGDAERMVAGAGVPDDAPVRRGAAADLSTARAYQRSLHGADDPSAWSAAADLWRAIEQPYDVARARFHEAEAILAGEPSGGARRDGRVDARAPLLESAAIAVELGAVPLLRALVDLADRARIELPAAALELAASRPAPPPEEARAPVRRGIIRREPMAAAPASFGLSPREEGVLAEIVAGRTNREIGKRLFISEKTVGVHVGNILAKLGVGGRVEAATVALRLGLVDDRLERTKKPEPAGPGFRSRRRGGAA